MKREQANAIRAELRKASREWLDSFGVGREEVHKLLTLVDAMTELDPSAAESCSDERRAEIDAMAQALERAVPKLGDVLAALDRVARRAARERSSARPAPPRPGPSQPSEPDGKVCILCGASGTLPGGLSECRCTACSQETDVAKKFYTCFVHAKEAHEHHRRVRGHAGEWTN